MIVLSFVMAAYAQAGYIGLQHTLASQSMQCKSPHCTQMMIKHTHRLQVNPSNHLTKLAGAIHDASHLSSKRERQFNSDLLAMF